MSESRDSVEAARLERLAYLETAAQSPVAGYEVILAYAEAHQEHTEITRQQREQQRVVTRKAGTIVRKVTVNSSETLSGPEFIFTVAKRDPKTGERKRDRMNDIVEPSGVETANFIKSGAPCLFNHDHNAIIGNWPKVSLRKDASGDDMLVGTLKLAPLGTSQKIDEIIRLVDAKVITSCSIGFSVIESKPLPGGGTYFARSELYECSLVSTPANADAVAVARSMHVSDETLVRVFGQEVLTGDDRWTDADEADWKAERALIHQDARPASVGLLEHHIDQVVDHFEGSLDELAKDVGGALKTLRGEIEQTRAMRNEVSQILRFLGKKTDAGSQ